MGKKGIKFSDAIRQAVDNCGKSRYRLCQLLGINQSTFSKFMHGGWLGVENMDRLAELLGLNITAEKKKPTKGSESKKG